MGYFIKYLITQFHVKISEFFRESHFPRHISIFSTCTVVNDVEDFYQDLKNWSHGGNSTILITKPSTYLKGANFAVYESIPEEKVKKSYFCLLFVETQQIVDTILEFVTYETIPHNLKGDMLSRNSWKSFKLHLKVLKMGILIIS